MDYFGVTSTPFQDGFISTFLFPHSSPCNLCTRPTIVHLLENLDIHLIRGLNENIGVEHEIQVTSFRKLSLYFVPQEIFSHHGNEGWLSNYGCLN
jgi:hypothetical protein